MLEATLFHDLLISAGKRNRLKREKSNLLWIVECEANNRTYLIIVDAVDQSSNKYYLNTGFVQVVDCSNLSVEQVTYLTVTVRVVSYSVELQVYIAQTRFGSFTTKLFTLSEFDPVGRRLHAVVPNFTRVPNRFKEVRRD